MNIDKLSKDLLSGNYPFDFPGHWINGKWSKQAKFTESKPSFNPNNGKELITVQFSKEAVRDAIEYGAHALKSYPKIAIEKRIEYLKKFRQILSDYQNSIILAMQLESGKPRWEALVELEAMLGYFDNVTANYTSYIENILAPAKLKNPKGQFELIPIGIVAAFLPFSTPTLSFISYLCSSVISGCPFVVVCSSHAAVNTLLYCHILQQAEFPPGAINVVFGNFTTFQQSLSDKRISGIIYKGSREHCDILRKENRAILGRELILQSGGKNSVIVHSTADISLAVKCVVYGVFKGAGQIGSSTSRVFVYRSKFEEFIHGLLQAINELKIGPTDTPNQPIHEQPFMGPLYSQKAVDKFLRFQTMANREAKENYLWGKSLDINDGYFVSPGVHWIEKFDNASAYQANVLFCPDLAIYEYDVLDDAIEKINNTDAPCTVSFIGDPQIIKSRTTKFLAPNILTNLPTVEPETDLPIAGRLQSGHHRYHGPGVSLLLTYPQYFYEGNLDPQLFNKFHK